MYSVSKRINFPILDTDSLWALVEGRRASGDVGDIAKHLSRAKSQLSSKIPLGIWFPWVIKFYECFAA